MPPEEAVLGRLQRMEDKLDKVTDAITTLARVEERQAHQREAIGRVWTELEKMDRRVKATEESNQTNATVLGLSGKFWWPVYTAVVVSVFGVAGWFLRGIALAN